MKNVKEQGFIESIQTENGIKVQLDEAVFLRFAKAVLSVSKKQSLNDIAEHARDILNSWQGKTNKTLQELEQNFNEMFEEIQFLSELHQWKEYKEEEAAHEI